MKMSSPPTKETVGTPGSMSEVFNRPYIKRRTPFTYLNEGFKQLGSLLRREYRYHRQRPIDTLFYLTYRCTSKCKTCTLWQRTDDANELTVDEWIRVADESAALGAKYFEIFGGDALLRPDVLVPLVKHISSKPGLISDMVTNCNLMTEKTAHELVEAGLNDLWLSIDGVAEDHNAVRGHDKTWTMLEKTVRWITDAKGDRKYPCLHANCTISNLNFDTFDKVLYYAEEQGLDCIHLEYAGEFWDELMDESTIDGVRPSPYFVQQDNRSILCNEEQAKVVKAKVEKMKQDVRFMNISLQCENIDKLTIRQMTDGLCDNRRCYITRSKITVDPRGNVLGCPFYGDWVMGNVRQQNLTDIWKNDKHKRFMKHFAKGPMKLCDHCILGVQRNPNPVQDIRDNLNRALGRARM